MCPPTYFAVRYRINPWMHPEDPVDVDRANVQWRRLHAALVELGHTVEVMSPRPGLPDMVFSANGGLVIGRRALIPRFKHPERAGETRHFAAALRRLGIREMHRASYINEGEGDFLATGGRLLAGFGPRTQRRALDEASAFFGVPVTALRLVDPRFYHLDTALGRIDERTIAYWPEAFSPDSRRVLAELFPDAIIADEEDANALALNLVSDGSTVITAPGRPRLCSQIAERGPLVLELPTDELRKAGGGAKCCVLELHDALAAG